MRYTINGIEYDINSSINQKIKAQFVGREVYSGVSNMVEYILQQSQECSGTPFGYEDIENYMVPMCPKCGDTCGLEETNLVYICTCGDERIISESELEDCVCETEQDYAYKCLSCEHIVESIEELDTSPQEIYEWWMVSSFLLEHLHRRGECVIIGEGTWGRRATGQAIKLDGIISRICYEIGILEGQNYEWDVA